MIRGVKITLASATLFFAPDAAFSSSISEARTKPVQFEMVSDKSIFDLERCIIELNIDLPPIVLRQPDRPDFTTIVYQHGPSLVALVELKANSKGTLMTLRGMLFGGGRGKEKLVSCG